MTTFTVSEESWNTKKDLITNKDTFKQEIYNILTGGVNAILENNYYKIVLPKTVSVSERHKLHKLTRTGFFPNSKGQGENRIMEIFIETVFVEHLNDLFYQPPEEVEVYPQPAQLDDLLADFKKRVLEDIMLLIEKHFNDIFLKFYN